MKSRSSSVLFFTLLLSVLCLSACRSQSEVALNDGAENNDVLLAGEQGFTMPLMASFSSDSGSFSYAISYDGAVLKMTDSRFPGAGVTGPSFKVEGGGTLGGQSVPVSELQGIELKSGEPVQVGLYDVYRYTDTLAINGKDCEADFALIPYGDEALKFQLTTCEGEDPGVGLMSLDTVLEGLEIH